MTQRIGSVECPQVHLALPPMVLVGSTESSVLRIYSICSSEVVAAVPLGPGLLQASVVDPVRALQCFMFLDGTNNLSTAVFTFGGPGFRTQTFTRGGGGAAQNAANNEPRSLFIQLLPLLLLFAFSFLSSLPNFFSTPPPPDPRFAFSSTARYNTEMETGGLGVHYFVNPTEFTKHPVIGAELAKEGIKLGRVVEEVISDKQKPLDGSKPESDGKAKTRKVVKGKGKQRGPALRKFEDMVDRVYTQDLYAQCRNSIDRKERAKEAEIGIFGIGTDWEKVKKIESEVIGSCEELKRLGVFNR